MPCAYCHGYYFTSLIFRKKVNSCALVARKKLPLCYTCILQTCYSAARKNNYSRPEEAQVRYLDIMLVQGFKILPQPKRLLLNMFFKDVYQCLTVLLD